MPAAAPAAPATDLAARYEREGHVVAKRVIDRELVEEGREHVAWLLKKHPGLRPEHLGHTLVTKDAFWVRLISDPRLLDVAQQFIGPDIALFASHYIAKPPGDGMPVLWHQDGSYWPLKPMRVVTLWLAFDDARPENGCMRVIPGTQNAKLEEMKPNSSVKSVLGSGMDAALVDESKARDVIVEAGDVSIHHPNVIHGSNANTSTSWRRGLTIRYIPTSTLIADNQPWPCSFLLRGKAVPGINHYLPYPRYSPETSIDFRGSREWNARIDAAG
jgi:ectoine hydroxylase-related dioxygenase (phytanoyl-CoA dioxygenase family)